MPQDLAVALVAFANADGGVIAVGLHDGTADGVDPGRENDLRQPIAKDTGLANLPPRSYDSNRIWCSIVMLAGDLLARMQTLALHDHPARQWEPKRLRHRLLTIPATLARTGRRVQLHLKDTAPFADLTCTGWTRLAALAPP